jgi:hypothetical protein
MIRLERWSRAICPRLDMTRDQGNRVLPLVLHLYGSERLATAYLQWMVTRADDLVVRNWRIVRALADRLLQAGSLNSAEILEAISGSAATP